jgi:hypothetical protein
VWDSLKFPINILFLGLLIKFLVGVGEGRRCQEFFVCLFVVFFRGSVLVVEVSFFWVVPNALICIGTYFDGKRSYLVVFFC